MTGHGPHDQNDRSKSKKGPYYCEDCGLKSHDEYGA